MLANKKFVVSLLWSALSHAAASVARGSLLDDAGEIDVTSGPGGRLLSKARKLNDNNEEATGWLKDYSLKFHSCYSVAAVGGEAGGRENEGQAGFQHIVRFSMCPSGSCSTCRHGGDYAVEMRDFVEAYMETKMEAEEQACENARENCYCNGNDDWSCVQTCYEEAGLDCSSYYNGNNDKGDDNDIQRFLECQPMNDGDGGNNNKYDYGGNDNSYLYVGPYCSRGGGAIYLGVFRDAACTVRADSSLYEQSNYGVSLPYSSTSLVGHDCVSCKNVEDQDGENDGNNQDNVNENCERLHEQSAKCETHLQIQSYDSSSYSGYYYTPHKESCAFIHKTLPSLASISKTNGRSLKVARSFAWIFAFTTIALAAMLYKYHKHVAERSGVNLSNQWVGEGMA